MKYLLSLTTVLSLLLGSLVFPTASFAALSAECKLVDFNNDGTIDTTDSQAVAFRVDKKEGQPGWDPKYDIVKDGVIDTKDVQAVFACDTFTPPITVDTSKINDINDPLPTSVTDRGIGGILTDLFSSILVFAGMVAVLVVIWGGFKYLTAQGDEKAVGAARGTITGAVIGLIIILSIAVIGFLLNAVLKINVFNG
jgi:hypothetical protein